MSRRRTWTDEDLTVAVAESISSAEVLRRLGLRPAGGTYQTIAQHIERLGLDMAHFKGQGWSKGRFKNAEEVKAGLLPFLRKGIRVAYLRDRLIASGLKKAECEECGLTEWRGQPAPLQVDHVDGDRLNNELENLRMLCANCHMLTETWGFKNGRRRPPHALVVETSVDTPGSDPGAL